LEGTRTDILDRIYRWTELNVLYQQSAQAETPSNDTGTANETGRIFWMSGPAGTGKTTISYTIAAACDEHGVLGASFFCSRDDAECSNPKLILTTIADQLCQCSPSFQAEIASVLKTKPAIGYSDVPYQLEELIVKPLQAVRDSFPRCVIVIDALDECKDNETTSIILSSLSRRIEALSPLKILITSRPEQNISSGFKLPGLGSATNRLGLHDVELATVQHDIERYLKSHLEEIRNVYNLKQSWPSEGDIHGLTTLSEGIFIFAATSIKFIQDASASNPQNQLSILLDRTARIQQSSSSPQHRLDELYTEVLRRAFPEITWELTGRLRKVLGSVVLLQDPLSPSALDSLLHLESDQARLTLVHLQSIVIVPEQDDGSPIRTLHQSFHDFIADDNRCLDSNFVVNPTAQHALLAQACLATMRNLRRDICEIRAPWKLNNEVEDLPTRIIKHISISLQYACRHWAFHIENAMTFISDAVLELLEEFCSKYMLYWIEVCSLMGELRNALFSLNAARRALIVSFHICVCWLSYITHIPPAESWEGNNSRRCSAAPVRELYTRILPGTQCFCSASISFGTITSSKANIVVRNLRP
jgi:hypothetical protein